MKCSYCTNEIEKGTGFAFVKKGGVVRYYCSGRCKRLNLVLNRKAKDS